MSVTYRDMSNNKTNKHQWIVLDGDIDAEWIESMNTVMDDNKMLTLASNERIPLTASMRLLLEINHMNHCSPATVSRGGVIYVNADDVGWKPVGLAVLSSMLLVITLFAHQRLSLACSILPKCLSIYVWRPSMHLVSTPPCSLSQHRLMDATYRLSVFESSESLFAQPLH